MEKKLNKVDQVKRTILKKGLQQSLVRYAFSKENTLSSKDLDSKFKEFVFREAEKIPETNYVFIQAQQEHDNQLYKALER